MRASSLALALLTCASSSLALAEGGVALAVTLPDKSAVNRDLAAGMVSAAQDRFAMLRPQLTPEDVQGCQTDEACLLRLARERGASHLLLVGVASLGPTEYVVSLRVLDVTSGAELTNLSDLASPGGDPHESGRALAANALADARGIPAKGSLDDVTTAPEPGPDASATTTTTDIRPLRRWDGLTPLSLLGWGVTGLTTLGAAAAVAGGMLLFTDSDGQIGDYSIYTGAAVVGGFAAGFGLIAADAYVLNGE